MLHSSLFWKKHFEHNITKQRVDWNQQPRITEFVKRKYSVLTQSLAAWRNQRWQTFVGCGNQVCVTH